MPKTREVCSINDFAFFARSAAFRKLSRRKFEAEFSEFLKLKDYEFYFEVGKISNFPIAYQLGQGKLYPYSRIPVRIQNHFAEIGSSDVPPQKYDDNIWFIQIILKAFGQHKAIENAIKAANQCFSIYRLIYLRPSNIYFPERMIPPFRYVGRHHDQILSVGYDFSDSGFERMKSNDKSVSELGNLVVKSDRSEIENRIVNAVDFLSLIGEVNPLRMKFLMCIIALEGLILSGEDKEYGLRKKLSEKIALLILQPRGLTSTVNYLDLDRETKPKSLVEARVLVARKLEKVYDKRSALAHLRAKDNEIALSEFDFAMRVLRLAILELNKLSKNGITHIGKKGGLLQDLKSLEFYFEKLKYGQPAARSSRKKYATKRRNG